MDQAQYKKANQSNKKLVLFSFAGPTKKSCPKDTTVKMPPILRLFTLQQLYRSSLGWVSFPWVFLALWTRIEDLCLEFKA
jgi:hypothetical protein